MGTVRPTTRWTTVVALYVALVAALTWTWAGSGGGFHPAELVTFLLLLPAGLVLTPVAYLVLGAAWAISGASRQDGATPVGIQVAYVLVFAALAFVNAVTVTAAARVLRRRPAREEAG
jgi:hypothetical protein